MISIDVVIPSRTTSIPLRKMTEMCIQSLRASESDNVGFNIIILEQIDNEEYSGADLCLHYDFEFNYNKVLNLGASNGKSPFILFSNNDVFYLHGFAEELLFALRMYDSVSPNDLKEKWYVEQPRTIEGYKVSELLHGWSFMCKRSIWEKMGGLDTDVSYWHSDYIYAEQLKYHGFKHALCTRSYSMHLHNATSDTMSKEFQKKISEENMPQWYNARKKYSKK